MIQEVFKYSFKGDTSTSLLAHTTSAPHGLAFQPPMPSVLSPKHLLLPTRGPAPLPWAAHPSLTERGTAPHHRLRCCTFILALDAFGTASARGPEQQAVQSPSLAGMHGPGLAQGDT